MWCFKGTSEFHCLYLGGSETEDIKRVSGD